MEASDFRPVVQTKDLETKDKRLCSSLTNRSLLRLLVSHELHELSFGFTKAVCLAGLEVQVTSKLVPLGTLDNVSNLNYYDEFDFLMELIKS